MKYSIFYLIKGPAEKYQQKLVKEVGPMFGENYMVENSLPAHITLHSPFELKSIKHLEELLNNFSKKHNKSKIKIEGFGNFKRFVAFLKTQFSKEGMKLQKELARELEKINIPSHKFDKKFKPHATISYGNTPETFSKIWDYLKKLENPKFEVEFDNLTIMKKSRNKWIIHKKFELK
jgi:2'-5' RNA ligase